MSGLVRLDLRAKAYDKAGQTAPVKVCEAREFAALALVLRERGEGNLFVVCDTWTGLGSEQG